MMSSSSALPAMPPMPSTDLLKQLFDAAVAAAMPQAQVTRVLEPYFANKPTGRVVVVGIGKSAAAMAKAVEDAWTKAGYSEPMEGLVITRYGHGVPTKSIEVIEAGHPVPDENGMAGAQRILQRVQPLTAADLVICLISGGGSALFTLPPEGISLANLADINRQLLASGADIVAMNTVRKALSCSSGGRLSAMAYPAQVVSLIISDVAGDSLRSIASGPTVGDQATAADALEIIDRYHMIIPEHVRAYLHRNPNPVIAPGDERLGTTTNHLIATPQQSLEAAAKVAIAHGYTPLILSDAIEGEARDVALVHGAIARQAKRHHQPVAPPCVILSGGETTVTVQQNFVGKGGRNSEFLLALAHYLNGEAGIAAIACDTDGIDGSEDNAGVLITPELWQQGERAQHYLKTHDSYSFFASIGALVVTGPTLTNVNDFRAILIEG
ncbi:glycerate kinase type-2 family protein [Leptothoe sp. PORK10 BA2]|uniref:glycerate kinase type-2 family protein n=1 Tax=Leptothoe sp. PORK10 BA2 TaxID=3110254 RepID=UPI002B2159F0|nr:glycerate kinase [Leptothoe sp. PORK10 BA2]MEA5462611.1 glycerate kinase [Leptothoe sp. PORK10 BA2]